MIFRNYSFNYFHNDYCGGDTGNIKIVDGNGRELITRSVEKDTADKIAKKLKNTYGTPFNWACITEVLTGYNVFWDFSN